jgi:hypothetical protein
MMGCAMLYGLRDALVGQPRHDLDDPSDRRGHNPCADCLHSAVRTLKLLIEA